MNGPLGRSAFKLASLASRRRSGNSLCTAWISKLLLCTTTNILATHWHDTKDLVLWIEIIRFQFFVKKSFLLFLRKWSIPIIQKAYQTPKSIFQVNLLSQKTWPLVHITTWFVQVSNFKQPIEYAKKAHSYAKKDFSLELLRWRYGRFGPFVAFLVK